MYLSELKLAGFKSFADRTRLVLEPGVSVIVGPNGSGKSNLVDAIAWVMGSQAPTALRTQKMDDVIFAGTSTRPPLGRAEVTLVFNNEDRALPLDLDEISMTRRLYRDGTSDYLIGGVECRLADIQDLLADSGVGRHQHTIVGQGQIDAVLGAGALEQRAVIEEAAGVLKHRVRKERALRRLERASADLVRLRDVDRELQRQIRPLKRQANAAERYEQIRQEVRELRLYVDALELSRVADDLAQAEEEDGARRRRAEQAAARLAETDLEIRDLDQFASSLSVVLESETVAAARLETALEKFERIAQVAYERRRAAETRADEAHSKAADLMAERAEVEATLAEDRQRREELFRDIESAGARLQSLLDEERVLSDQVSLPAEGVLATLQGEISSLERAEEREGEELSQLEAKLRALDEHLAVDMEERQRLDGEVKALDEELSSATESYEEARETRQREQAAWEASDRALVEARLTRGAAMAAASVLELVATPSAPEDALRAQGVGGQLSLLLDIPEDVLPAVSAALEGWWEALTVEKGLDLPSVLVDLQERGVRGFRVLAEPRPFSGETIADRVGRDWGLEPLTERLGPGAWQDLAVALLGDVVLVEGWAAGWEVVRRTPEVRAVTPEGDLITRLGVALHSPDRSPAVLLGEARGALETAEIELARRESLFVAAKRSFDHARTAERAALEVLERIEASLAGATETLDRTEREESARHADRARLALVRTALEQSRRDRSGRLHSLRVRIEEVADTSPDQRRLREESMERLGQVTELRQAEAARRDRAAADLAAVSERLRLFEERNGVLEGQLAEMEAGGPGQVQLLSVVEVMAREAQAVVSTLLADLRVRVRGRQAQQTEARQRLEIVTSERDRLRSEIESLRERRAELAVHLTELRLRIESIAEGLRRDLDTTPDAALQAPIPELDPDVSPHARLEELEAGLRRIGPVNPLAAQEYRELSDRVAFLGRQVDDIESSRRKLARLIANIDNEIAELFAQAFHQVAGLFSEHFRILFPGGTGKLRLTEPEDPLSSGVEILAQPMGKRVSRLSLLSGGEKSLAALAFLFAVFRARPSPFYVLDEVEAALDDANLRRFLRLLEEIRYEAQLVIVTHQQHTMEAADVLYGITLEPGGSTQVVSKRLVPA